MMKKLGLAMFVTLVVAYLVAFVITGICLYQENFLEQHMNPVIGGLAFLIVIAFQFSWGLIAGIVENHRGWLIGRDGHTFGNAVALISLNFAFAAPTAIIAVISVFKYGKIIPAPSEC